MFFFCKPKPGEFKDEALFVEIYESLTFLKISDFRSKIKLTIDIDLVPATTRLYKSCNITLEHELVEFKTKISEFINRSIQNQTEEQDEKTHEKT